jgi:hypothetical protein
MDQFPEGIALSLKKNVRMETPPSGRESILFLGFMLAMLL